MPIEPLAADLVLQLSRLSAKLTKRIDGALCVHGISFTEFMVMYYLSNSALNTMRRIELAGHIGISASGVTRLLAPMEKIGLVEKEANPRDARQSLVKLSGAGQRLYGEAQLSFEHSCTDMTRALGARQLEKLLELLAKIA